ncbi:MAG: helix-turn-helix domain-containing protein [Hyphomicrobiaceae bacterium]
MASDKGNRGNRNQNGHALNPADLSDSVVFDSSHQYEEVAGLALNPMSSAGLLLGKLRRIENLTQTEVARRMDTTQPSIARLEKGTSQPNLTTIERYVAALSYRGLVVLRDASVAGDGQLQESRDVSDVQTVTIAELMTALTELRKRKGLTQTFVAGSMDTTQPMVARLERANTPANVRTLERFAAAIGVTLELMFKPRS